MNLKENQFKLDSVGRINKAAKNRLNEAEIYSVKDLVVRGAMNVSESTSIPLNTCSKICINARVRLEKLGIMNGSSFMSPEHRKLEGISLGSTALDALLGGRGLHTEAITEFFGESNSGKTQLCHTLCIMVQLDKHQGGLTGKALYIDTESTFTRERMGSIAEARGLDKDIAIRNILVAKANSSLEQERCVERAGSVINEHKSTRLLIVDSVTGLYRAEYTGRAALPERQHRLYRHMLMLKRLSEVYGVAVAVTNQVNEIPDNFTGPFPHKPIGGNVMAHSSQFRIRLREFGGDRIAGLTHSPYLPAKQSYFGISTEGVYDAPK